MSLMHQNVQSLGNSVDQLQLLLADHVDCKYLCISEHWKTADQLQLHGIGGFYLASGYCREEGEHGGVAVYVKCGVKSKDRSDINKLSVKGDCEIAAVESLVDKMRVMVISIYRSPRGCVDVLLDRLEQILARINDEKTVIFIAGDFNIDFLSNDRSRFALLSVFESFSLYPTILGCTRITAVSESCIDNIFTNLDGPFETDIIHSNISDHTAQKISFLMESTSKPKYLYRRLFSEENIVLFKSKLQCETWESVYQCQQEDVNWQWNVFMQTFLGYFNECFPEKMILQRQPNAPKVQIDNETAECKRLLDVLGVMSRVDNQYKPLYKIVKRQYNDKLVNCRKLTYENMLQRSWNKSKCTWDIVNRIKGTYKDTDFPLNGDPMKTADDFNNLLVNAVPQLSSGISAVPFEFNIRHNDKTMFVYPVTEDEVVKICTSLKDKISSGCDGVPTRIIKRSGGVIKKIVCYIINNSLKFGIFPEQLKLALVIPVHKKGDRAVFDNYRPISLLTAFSKIFETAMCGRLVSFLTSCNLLNGTQHGYIKNRSTQTAVFQFTQQIINALENGDMPLGLFLDLSKAYDSLDYDILLLKLQKYGVRGPALMWFNSYLTGRQQKVVINSENRRYSSSALPLKMGVPQGSIAGPILFVLYINDLPHIVNNKSSFVTNYADDSNLLITASTYQGITRQTSSLMSNANEWFAGNKLILNRDKTSVVIFKTKQSRFETPTNITVNDTVLSVCDSTKFLGIHIDEFLSWNYHIEYLCKKLNGVCYCVRILSRYSNLNTLKIVYFASFESLIRYGVVFWGSSSEMNTVFLIQKRVIRILLRLQFRETCRGHFKSQNILTVVALYIMECLLFMFKHREFFEACFYQHGYDTRREQYKYPIHRLSLTEKGAHYCCIKFFNKLPQRIRLLSDIKVYKREIKRLLMEIEPYTVREYSDYKFV